MRVTLKLDQSPPKPGDIAFRIWSSGPNRVNENGNGDDIALRSVTYGMLQTKFGGSEGYCP
jgi:hypothetical protein